MTSSMASAETAAHYQRLALDAAADAATAAAKGNADV